MKLIIKEYLASLNEREELDAVLPDLLSQLGLNVYSRPARGTTQYGVDVAAVGSLDDEPEAVYLLSIKSGDLAHESWNTGSQSLKQSIDQIINVYIPCHIPNRHKGKKVIICLCFGGYIKEQIRLEVTRTLEKLEEEEAEIG